MVVVGLFAALVCGAFLYDIAESQSSRCAPGHVRGFAIVRGDPRLGGVGAIPNHFTGSPLYFEIRYNCSGKGVVTKRVDEGVYDILFPKNPTKTAIVSALDNGAATSVDRIGDGMFRITVRGPVVQNDILRPREAGFYIAVF